MAKELVMIVFIAFMVLFFFPYIGTLLSIVGVLILASLPIILSVVFLIPSLRSHFLSI